MSFFTPAAKDDLKLKMALFGPSKSGKTYTALNIAQHFGRIALVDSEHKSARKYADIFEFDDHVLTSFAPELYIQAITKAENAGYDVLIIDSLSHEWSGKNGVLEKVDEQKKRYGGNDFRAWSDVTPKHREVIDRILSADIHVIATMRSKTAYEVVSSEEGKMKDIKKLGLEPIQGKDIEFEFDVLARMDMDNNMIVDGSRCIPLNGRVFHKPGEEVATIISDWLEGEKISDDERKRFHALGNEIYDGEWDEKRPKLVEWATDGRTTSSKQLMKSEIQRLIRGLENKQNENTKSAVADNSATANSNDD